MDDYHGRQLASKWAKTAALLSHSELAPHIPPTSRYSGNSLRSMLDVHGVVVLKPIVGAGGIGVIRAAKKGKRYTYEYYAVRKSFNSFQDLQRAIDRLRKGKAYLIQKGITLAKVDGRPIDYRVKYVKTEDGWHYRSMVGRIARKGLFVTNLCRGGTMVKAAEGIRRSLSAGLIYAKKQHMRQLTVLSTQVLEKHFPGIGQLGFDYGIDTSGKLWIFEVNTRPQ